MVAAVDMPVAENAAQHRFEMAIAPDVIAAPGTDWRRASRPGRWT